MRHSNGQHGFTLIEALIASGRLADYFESDLEINQVEPISFTVRNLGDNTLATVADTTSSTVGSKS